MFLRTHIRRPSSFFVPSRTEQNHPLKKRNSEIHRQIMATSDPREQKALGRKVRGFDAALWDKQGYDVVVEGNLAKFRQNPSYRDELLATGDRVRVLLLDVVVVGGGDVVSVAVLA